MKLKGVVAVCLVAAAGSAHAQSSVTLYGMVDGSMMWQTSSAASYSTKAKNNGGLVRYKDGGIYASFWGMRAVEDLGGGYQAVAQLQGSFDSGTGKLGLGDSGAPASTLFTQIATIGLNGGFGSLKVGRQYAPMILALTETDVRHAEYFGSMLTALIGLNSSAGWVGASTNGAIGSVYDSNAIVYQSPSLGGVSATLEYAPGGVAGSFQGGTRESAILRYSGYGLKVDAIYYNGHDTNPGATTVASGLDNNRFMSLSALYSRGSFSVSGSFSNGRNPSNSAHVNLDMISGGLAWQFTPAFSMSTAIYFVRDNKQSANESAAFVLGTDYSLSKATSVYARVGYVNNRGTMNQGLVYGQPVAPGVGTSAAMVGLRHRF